MSKQNSNKAASIKRKQRDIFKLRTSDHKVTETEQKNTYQIEFYGPKQTVYETGKWKISLYLPEQYPYKSPSVGFLNKIYHPNIDLASGSVCLDVINQTWTPMYELINIFQIFLPQLLTYPNPSSPLNHEAATLFNENQQKYKQKVKQYILKYGLGNEKLIQNKKMQQQKIQINDSEQQQDAESQLSEVSGLQKNQQLSLY